MEKCNKTKVIITVSKSLGLASPSFVYAISDLGNPAADDLPYSYLVKWPFADHLRATTVNLARFGTVQTAS